MGKFEDGSAFILVSYSAERFERSEPVDLNRDYLSTLGYGKAALDTLEAGVPISYSDDETPADCTIIEYPDGSRFLERGEWQASAKQWRIDRLKELPRAPR